MHIPKPLTLILFAGYSLAGGNFENWDQFEIFGGADQPGECTGQLITTIEQTCGLAGFTQVVPNAACIMYSGGQGQCCGVYLYADDGCTEQVACFTGTNIGEVLQIDFSCMSWACDDPQGCPSGY